MSDVLDTSALTRWQRQPLNFITEILRDPETGKPFVLLDAERAFLEHALRTDDSGRLIYPEQVYACPKKSGKTGFAAMHLLTTTLVFGGRFAEGYAIANDFDQAQGRVFQAVRRICEASPHLRRECNITASRVEFPQTGAVIQAIGSDYAGSAGANPVISSFDELWGYVSERSRRLWDEMVPSPVRKISARLVTTYAGFEGESVLLEELHKRGLAQQQVGDALHAGDGLLMFWSHMPVAPWQTERWLADMRRSLRPNQYLRMIENRFVSTESSFVDMADWDACVDPAAAPLVSDRALPIWSKLPLFNTLTRWLRRISFPVILPSSPLAVISPAGKFLSACCIGARLMPMSHPSADTTAGNTRPMGSGRMPQGSKEIDVSHRSNASLIFGGAELMTDEQWGRCQGWFDKRNGVMATEVEKIVDAERERVEAKVARMSPNVVLKVIERLREEPYPQLDRVADPRKALAKWIEADNRWKAAQALAEVYETALAERCGPQPDDRS